MKFPALFSLFSNNIDRLIELLGSCNLVEMDNDEIIGHE